MRPSDLSEILPQGHGPVGDQGVVLVVVGAEELCRRLFRLLLVDHQIIESQHVVFVADGAAVFWVYEYEHRYLLGEKRLGL